MISFVFIILQIIPFIGIERNSLKKRNYNYASLSDLLNFVDEAYTYLDGKIEFSNKGYPLFKKEHFLKEWPDDMVTFKDRNNPMVIDKTKTVLCFYQPDARIFTRFVKVFDEIEIYKNYLGCVTPDITVTFDMDLEFQRMIMLINQLFAAILVVNGIKIAFNTRTGSIETEDCLTSIPKNVACSSGFLGCKSARNHFQAKSYINKILALRPSMLLIYGKKDRYINEQMDLLGIQYRYYEDYHTRSKNRRDCNVRL
ncbi:MAG: DUF4417 domain-containing protein [Erysipelotrichaceae bacterium]|nr:DUF4417 domain-containing protein [Erysipelotrichaceae bacterium]